MKVKELIKKLEDFDGELSVTITDGFECAHYHTLNLEFQMCIDDDGEFLDIGIGGNRM